MDSLTPSVIRSLTRTHTGSLFRTTVNKKRDDKHKRMLFEKKVMLVLRDCFGFTDRREIPIVKFLRELGIRGLTFS